MKGVSRAWRIGLCALVVAALQQRGTASALGQKPAPAEFSSDVELVTVDAVVVDANGRSVGGLTKNDFVVEEDGRPQEIVNFEAVSVPVEGEAAASPPPPSVIATNTSAEREPRRAFAILVDDLRLPGEQSQKVLRIMTGFINGALGAGDEVIVGTTSGEAWWSTRMPEGRDDLATVLERVKGRYVDPGTREHMTEYEAYWIVHRSTSSSARPGSVVESLRQPTDVFERVVMRFWDENLCGAKSLGAQGGPNYDACWPIVKAAATGVDAARSRRTSLTLRAIARAVTALAPYYGRTSLVFLSPGFLQDNDLSQQDVAAAALQAHTALYFVDVRGLVVGSFDASAPSDLQFRENPSREAQRGFEERNVESDGARALADETGGFTVRNTNDLAGAAERIAAESRTFYLLGFHPPAGKRENAWRKVRVSVTRSDVTIRARRGYRLEAVAAGARRGSGRVIPLRLASYVLEPLAGSRTRVVAVTEIDTSDLAATRNEPETGSPLQLRLEATPRGGGETQVQDVSLQAAPPGAKEGSRAGSGWRVARLELALPAGIHGLRAFVRDPTTGRIGVAEQRIVVPEDSAFRVSTPVVSDQATASREGGQGPSPLPVAHDEFSPKADRPLLFGLEVFGAARGATGDYGVETRTVLEDPSGKPLASPVASSLAPSPDGRLRQVIALPQLPAGDYAVVVGIEDRVAGSRQEVSRRFRIEGAQSPAPVAEASPASTAPTAPPPDLATLLDRVGRYVLTYGRAFSHVLADEECRQIYEPDSPERRKVRNTKAGVFFVTVPGPLPWVTFRDVWEVDGSQIGDRKERLSRLFHDSPATAGEDARAILEESARYNLGPVRRTVNIPTLALLFLHPENQRRFAFEIKGKRKVEGTDVVELAFRERGRPTVVSGDTSAGAPVKGRAWIDPVRGSVLKTDADYDIDPLDSHHRSRARVVTEYRAEAALGLLVPDRMQETYKSPVTKAPTIATFNAHARMPDAREESGVLTVEASTRYSAYRRFGVTTEETYTSKKPE